MRRVKLNTTQKQKQPEGLHLAASSYRFRKADFKLDHCLIEVQEIHVKVDLGLHSAVHYG